MKDQLGIEKFMWGSDYPHHEATSPFSIEAIRYAFEGWAEADLRKVLATNAAEVYGFDLAKLAPITEKIGPTVEQIATPLPGVPEGATGLVWGR